MQNLTASWPFWALLSAVFAALTAIFAKVGVAGVSPDFATFFRTIVVIVALAAVLTLTGQWEIPAAATSRTWVFLTLSGLATGASWLCYFRALQIGDASLVAPIDKLSVVLVALFAVAFLGEKLSLTNWAGIAMIGGGAVLVAIKA
jgi:transporter family protein